MNIAQAVREERNGKVKFILSWYKHERKHLNTPQRLELLRSWITSCIQFEEFEMVVVLRTQRNILIREYRKEKGLERTFWAETALYIRSLKRELFRLFK